MKENNQMKQMELLHQIYRISSPSGRESQMMKFLRRRLNQLGVAHVTDKAGNIYATKGVAASYPCIIAHTDEVHSFREKGYDVVQAVSKDKNIIFGFNHLKRSHCGTGADDKNGLWICLKCLEEFDAIKCVFFVGEEIGCHGSSRADMKFFDDCRFVVQCDRKGNSDMVTFYSGSVLCSDDFLLDTAPDKFGYKQSEGLITDVITLKHKGLKISGINLSCGYYLPHSPHEFTCVEDLMNCYRFVQHIIRNCKKTYHHQFVDKYTDRYYSYDPLPYWDDHSRYRFMDNNDHNQNTRTQTDEPLPTTLIFGKGNSASDCPARSRPSGFKKNLRTSLCSGSIFSKNLAEQDTELS